MEEVRNEQWTRDAFERRRQEVLTQWPTGKMSTLKRRLRITGG